MGSAVPCVAEGQGNVSQNLWKVSRFRHTTSQGASCSGMCSGQTCLDPISLPSLQMFLATKKVSGSTDVGRDMILGDDYSKNPPSDVLHHLLIPGTPSYFCLLSLSMWRRCCSTAVSSLGRIHSHMSPCPGLTLLSIHGDDRPGAFTMDKVYRA